MSAPIKNTCPDIDRAIKHLKEAINEINSEVEDKTIRNSIIYEIEIAIDYFEDIRSANDTLRAWGNELEDQLQEAAEKINELEEKIETINT